MNICIALIVAAGRGRRLGGELPKQYRPICGQTVIGLTLQAFAAHPGVDAIRVVIHPDDHGLYQDAVDKSGCAALLLEPVHGGTCRQESVLLGLASLAPEADGITPDRILIHDAARPFVSAAVIDRVLAALRRHAAVIPALPVNDTLKRKRGNTIAGTVERSELVRAQTPQGFHFTAILAAHRYVRENIPGRELTDDAAVAEYAGLGVNIVDGDEENVKITSRQDLWQAEQTLAAGRSMDVQPKETRTGFGFDVHRFEKGDGVMLCGVFLPHDASLAGHSDADVGLHALTDALLGAVGEGDIGLHFPPTERRWKGAKSDIFVGKAGEIIADIGGRIINVDITLICENPKISPYRQTMRERVAAILGIDLSRVSVKATTTERLGFTGRNEGVAAQAVASVELPAGQ